MVTFDFWLPRGAKNGLNARPPLEFGKKRDCTIRVAKTKALISFAATVKLICVFVFAYAKIRFSHDKAHMCCIMRKPVQVSDQVRHKLATQPQKKA